MVSYAITSLDRRNNEIIKAYLAGDKVSVIADKYDLSPSHVHAIVAACKKRQKKTPQATIDAVLDLHKKRYPQSKIVNMLGLSRQLVSRIICKHKNKDKV